VAQGPRLAFTPSDQSHHVVGLGALDSSRWHGAVERGELALVVHRQGQQVGVGQLAVAQQVCGVEGALLHQADRVGPKMVVSACTQHLHLCQHLRNGSGARVGGCTHDADGAVLREWAAGPADGGVRYEPLRGDEMVLVAPVAQSDEYVDVQQADAWGSGILVDQIDARRVAHFGWVAGAHKPSASRSASTCACVTTETSGAR